MLRFVLLVAMLACVGCRPAPPGVEVESLAPPTQYGIDKATIEAWRQRGFHLTWIDRGGYPLFWANKDAKKVELRGLPQVEVPFGLGVIGEAANDELVKELPTQRNLTRLHFSYARLTDAGMRELADFKQLTTLVFLLSRSTPPEKSVTEDGLKLIAGMENLSALDLGYMPVTDAVLKELARLPNLQKLGLEDAAMTDEGVKHITKMKRLTSLKLSYTKVTDAGVKELTALADLAELELYGMPITDDCLEHVAGLPRLAALGLSDKQVTDRALKVLYDRNLVHTLTHARARSDTGRYAAHGWQPTKPDEVDDLILNDTAVTDAGLKYLTGLRNLKRLELRRTPVADAGVKELQKALTNCKIVQ